jgi:hypothetical protein
MKNIGASISFQNKPIEGYEYTRYFSVIAG